MGTDERPRGAREDREGDEERPPPEDRDGGVDPDERVADGPAGATEAETPGMGS
jgi:hypothetical protein